MTNPSKFRKGQKFSFPKTCAICGKPFIGTTGVAKYCKECKTKKCLECGKPFTFDPSQEKHYPAQFCSQKCSATYYYRTHPELKDKLKENARRGERHQFWKGGKEYRKHAFERYGQKCEICGYDKYPELLWVHHKDFSHRGDAQNNSLDNLQVLCIRCHMELHLEAGEKV